MSAFLTNGSVLWLQLVMIALVVVSIAVLIGMNRAVIRRLEAAERSLAQDRMAAVEAVQRRADDLASQAEGIAKALDDENVRRAAEVALTLEQKLAIVERKLDTVAADVVHGIAATHNVIVHELSPDDASQTTRETITEINKKADLLLGKIEVEAKPDADPRTTE